MDPSLLVQISVELGCLAEERPELVDILSVLVKVNSALYEALTVV